MNQFRIPDGLGRSIMEAIHSTIDNYARRTVGYLRVGARNPGEEYMSRFVLPLADAKLSKEQLDSLEDAFRLVQEELIDWFFCMVDGSWQPKGFPKEMRLVNMDNGEVICPEELGWAFGMIGYEVKSALHR